MNMKLNSPRQKMVRWPFLVISVLLLLGYKSKEVSSSSLQSQEGMISNLLEEQLLIEETVWQEDEDWWEGAEEIDLTLPRSRDEDVDINVKFFLNESFLMNLECSRFLDLSPPPNYIENIPPPPFPVFLKSTAEETFIEQSSYEDPKDKGETEKRPVGGERDYEGEELEEDLLRRKLLDWIVVTSESKECSFCDWAQGNGGNNTYEISTIKNIGTQKELRWGTIGALIGVALISAAVGATIMGILLRCRRLRNSQNQKDSCGCLPKRNWRKSSSEIVTEDVSEVPSVTEADKDEPSTGMNWSAKRWQRHSSQSSLRPSISPGSENSYSEEPYVNAGSNCAVYAELNSPKTPDAIRTFSPNPTNPYSEIPEQVLCSADKNNCSRSFNQEETYENACYTLSETPSEPNGSSGCSTSTPSSAYYSDVSVCEIQSNKRKKKKRKGDVRFNPNLIQRVIGNNFLPSSSLVNSPISSIHTIPLNEVPMHSQCFSRGEALPLSAHNLQADQFGLTCRTPLSLEDQNIIHKVALSSPKYFLNLKNSHNLNSLSSVEHSTNSHYHGNDMLVEELGIQCSNPANSNKRPLPPLPSRQVNGPKRRIAKFQFNQDISAVPSEYV